MTTRGLFLADNQATTMRAFRRRLRLDFNVMSCRDTDEAKYILSGFGEPPECAVLDLELGDTAVLGLVQELRNRIPKLPILVLTVRDCDDDSRLRALGAEVISRWHHLQLESFLRLAPLAPVREIPQLSLAIEQLATSWGLRPREVRILAFLASGSTRATLAKDIDVKEDTLKSQLAGLFQRTGLGSTNDLLAHVLRAAARGSERSPQSGESNHRTWMSALTLEVDATSES